MEYLSYLYFYKIYWSIGDLHVVLISAVQQSDSVIHIHIIHIFFIFFSFIIYYRILSIVIQWKKLKVKSLSHVQLFATPWTVAYQASQSMEFSRQEYWSGLSFPLQGIFRTQDRTRVSCVVADALLSSSPYKTVIISRLKKSFFVLFKKIKVSSRLWDKGSKINWWNNRTR